MASPGLKPPPRVPHTPDPAPPSCQPQLAIVPTPAALDAVADFQPLAVWGEITEKPPVGLGAKERRGADRPPPGSTGKGSLCPKYHPIYPVPKAPSSSTGKQCHLGRGDKRDRPWGGKELRPLPESAWDKEGDASRMAVAREETDCVGQDPGPLRLWRHLPGKCCVRLSSFWYLG